MTAAEDRCTCRFYASHRVVIHRDVCPEAGSNQAVFDAMEAESMRAEACPRTGRSATVCTDPTHDTCPDIRVMRADAARAVGKFRPEGVEGYRAATAPGAPLRATRAEAVEDERAWLDAR